MIEMFKVALRSVVSQLFRSKLSPFGLVFCFVADVLRLTDCVSDFRCMSRTIFLTSNRSLSSWRSSKFIKFFCLLALIVNGSQTALSEQDDLSKSNVGI